MPINIVSRYDTIRQGLATTLSTVPGIVEFKPYPPDAITKNGTGWVGFIRTLPSHGLNNQQTWTHLVPLTVVALRGIPIEDALKALQPICHAVITKLYASQDLGITPMPDHVVISDWEQGIWSINEYPHVGFQARIEITERVVIPVS